MRLGAGRGGVSAGAAEEALHRPRLCRGLLAFPASETSDLAGCPIGIPFDVRLTKIFLNSFLKNLPNCELYCLSEEGICISAIACEYKRAINNINVV